MLNDEGRIGKAKFGTRLRCLVVLCSGDFEGCHSKERSDEESHAGRADTRFLACTALRLGTTTPQRAVDQVLVCLLAVVCWLLSFAHGLAAEQRWKEAVPGYEFSFPRDHAAHPDYRIEWWYYTGNLETADGRRFGYQLTFFRTGIASDPANPSRWTVRDLYMAHFAISDFKDQRFYAFEKLNRAGVGWAGAEATHYRVWNEGWEARLEGDQHVLSAAEGNVQLAVTLTPEKIPVIHGENGVSQKGAAAGNASHYYSLTRLRTAGTLTVNGEALTVSGLSWMDHEFGTSFLEPEQVGWDWFSLQLNDGRELMLFQIRRADGSTDPHSSGTLIDPDGHATRLAREDFTLTPSQPWRSAVSGASYPMTWKVTAPAHGLHLLVRAAFPGQELQTTASTGVIYWEGSIVVSGGDAAQGIVGRGYVEMTGYIGKRMGAVFAP
ncbi:MAG: carotenoid 1,2-hydratase [Deltaproteobacteria bacterium]|nr:carotenoid 1,2-hydratase [Deltaproteobacteria bacterium]